MFFKIEKYGLREYLLNIIPESNHEHNTRAAENCWADIFKYSCFSATIMEWNKLDIKVKKFKSLPYFRNALLKVGRPAAKPIYNIQNLIDHS